MKLSSDFESLYFLFFLFFICSAGPEHSVPTSQQSNTNIFILFIQGVNNVAAGEALSPSPRTMHDSCMHLNQLILSLSGQDYFRSGRMQLRAWYNEMQTKEEDR